MQRIRIALLAAALVVGGAGLWKQVTAQQFPQVGDAPIDHIGVVVADVEATLEEYVRVMGFTGAKVLPLVTAVPGGQQVRFRLVVLAMPNFHIELLQPDTPVGPYHDHLRTFGMSVHHLGFVNPGSGNIDDMRKGLEQKGGRWTFGPTNSRFAYLDFRPTLGASFELLRGGAAPAIRPTPASPADPLPPLASLAVTHVGFAVTDAAGVAARFSNVFGTPSPKVREYKDAQYPPDTKWNRGAVLRLASWSQGGMGLELTESVGGPTPWSQSVARQKGSSVHHLAIDVGNRMDEMIRDLQAKGGTWTNGKPGGTYAYLDFTDTLGLVLELNGTSKSAK